MARSKSKTAAVVEEAVLTQQPESVAPVEATTLAVVVAKTLALCGTAKGAWHLGERFSGEADRLISFRISHSGLMWEDTLHRPAGECEGPEFEAALAAMADRVYAGAAAELANRVEG